MGTICFERLLNYTRIYDTRNELKLFAVTKDELVFYNLNILFVFFSTKAVALFCHYNLAFSLLFCSTNV